MQVQHCADFFNAAGLAVIACLPSLKVLRLEDIRTRVDQNALAELSRLTQVQADACDHASDVCVSSSDVHAGQLL